MPVQHKLEREVEDLKETIAAKEHEVRMLAKKRFEAEESPPPARKEAIKRVKDKLVVPLESAIENMPVPSFSEIATSQSEVIEHTPIVEAQLAAARPEAMPSSAEQLSLNRVLQIAETVKVGEVSLKEMYETNRLYEEGLRKAVTEHLRGGSVESLLPTIVRGEEYQHERALDQLKTMHDNAAAFAQSVAAPGTDMFSQSPQPSTGQMGASSAEGGFPFEQVTPPGHVMKTEQAKAQTKRTGLIAFLVGIGLAVIYLLIR
jgi:hypothetical protein